MKKPTKIISKDRTIQISDHDSVLTQMEAARVLQLITAEHVKLLSQGKPEGIRGRCEYAHGAYVGPGVCIAYKYVPEMLTTTRKGCGKCCSQEVVDQLNFIFEHAFEGKYKAEWRAKRKYRKRTKKLNVM